MKSRIMKVLNKLYRLKNRFKETDFCCADMHENVIGPEGDGCELHFGYFARYREYFIPYKKKCGGAWQLISFCPWCGKSLPKPLDDEFIKELSKATGISEDDIDFETYLDPKVPEEFRSDAWWKKRNL